MKKKVLALTLALTMAMGMTCTVFAAEKTPDLTKTSKSKDVTVQYTVDETYEVTIPADVDFANAAVAENDEKNTRSTSDVVEAKNVLIANGNKLTVTMKATNADDNSTDYALKYEDSSITYTIKKGDDAVDVKNNTAVLTVEPKSDNATGAAEGSVTLTFATNDEEIAKATMAGDHKDTLTFTVAVEKPETKAAEQ